MSTGSIGFIWSVDLIRGAVTNLHGLFLMDNKRPNLLVVALELLPH